MVKRSLLISVFIVLSQASFANIFSPQRESLRKHLFEMNTDFLKSKFRRALDHFEQSSFDIVESSDVDCSFSVKSTGKVKVAAKETGPLLTESYNCQTCFQRIRMSNFRPIKAECNFEQPGITQI